jgi:hypothetical protein
LLVSSIPKRGYFVLTIILSHSCFATVTGLPEPRHDHAVVMVKFAKEMIQEMKIVTSKLETRLGPGTSSLGTRIGVSFMHIMFEQNNFSFDNIANQHLFEVEQWSHHGRSITWSKRTFSTLWGCK